MRAMSKPCVDHVWTMFRPCLGRASATSGHAISQALVGSWALGETYSDISAFEALFSNQEQLFGLDLGTKTIGVALSDVTRMIASPLETIRRTRFKADAARLFELAAEHGVAGLVLGFPISMDGTEGPRCQATRAFARNVNQLSTLPILLWDERLTTAAAERMLIDADASRRRRAEVIDKLAATLILQGALDRMRAM